MPGPEGVKALTFLKQLADGGHLEKDLLTGLPKFERRVDQGRRLTWSRGWRKIRNCGRAGPRR